MHLVAMRQSLGPDGTESEAVDMESSAEETWRGRKTTTRHALGDRLVFVLAGTAILAVAGTMAKVVEVIHSAERQYGDAPTSGVSRAQEQKPFPSQTVHANINAGGLHYCCTENLAKCRACAVGETVHEFCAARAAAADVPIPGCEHVNSSSCCADADRAKCRACSAGQSLEDFCAVDANKEVTGCSCKLLEEEMDYPGGDLYHLTDVQTPEACCSRCRHEPKCTSWTFAYPHWCSLKSQTQLKRRPAKGHTSGLPGRQQPLLQMKLLHGYCLSLSRSGPTRGSLPAVFAGSRVADVDQHLNLELCDTTALDAQQIFHYDRFTGELKHHTSGLCVAPKRAEVGSKLHVAQCGGTDSLIHWQYLADGQLRLTDSGLCAVAEEINAIGGNAVLTACDVTNDEHQWDMWIVTPGDASLAQHPTTPPASDKRNTTLYCVATMLPWGGELGLLKLQRRKGLGIFACEDYDVYSNVIIDLGGFATRMIYTDLHCSYGATVINTPVFTHFWKQLISDGRFRLHDWTVKVDPDTVFIPSRLHDVVQKQDPQLAFNGRGMFLNDCSNGLHGPIEVLSRLAVETYGAESEACHYYPQEDVYMRMCLAQLNVSSKPQYDLLAEAHCHTPGWHSCEGARAAFHPFKTVDGWEACHDRAEAASNWQIARVDLV